MGEEKQIIMYANLPEPQKLTAEKVTGEYHLVARSEGLVSMTVNLPSNVNSVVDFYFNRHIHKEVQAVDGVATLVTTKVDEGDVEFPTEVLREPGFTVSIIYENENNQITTNYVFFPVYTNGIGEEPLEYDDDSYIDAKIAREAAEYALEEIDDLTDRVTTLESDLTTLSSVVETTISSLEEFEETTTSSFITVESEISNIEEWIDYNQQPIFYNALSTDDLTKKISIYNTYYNTTLTTPAVHNELGRAESGFISSRRREMYFTITFPKKLRKPPTGYRYVLKDLAIIARGEGGFYGDYYAHRINGWNYMPSISNLITTATSGDNEYFSTERIYALGFTRSDMKNSSLGYDGCLHNSKVQNGEIIRAPMMDSPNLSADSIWGWDEIKSDEFRNTPGLLIKNNGTPVNFYCYNPNTSGTDGNTASPLGSYSISTRLFDNQKMVIVISMPITTGAPAFGLTWSEMTGVRKEWNNSISLESSRTSKNDTVGNILNRQFACDQEGRVKNWKDGETPPTTSTTGSYQQYKCWVPLRTPESTVTTGKGEITDHLTDLATTATTATEDANKIKGAEYMYLHKFNDYGNNIPITVDVTVLAVGLEPIS